MHTIRAVKAAVFVPLIIGGLISGGCGGNSAPTSGTVIAEDPKIYQDREKAISEAYKNTPPPSPFKK